ncbi:MAG: hypothetical protein AB7G06_02435 [Bdellovibrionales bacterium]
MRPPFARRLFLKHRLALWMLDQALPDPPALAGALRAILLTMAVGAAAGVAALGFVAAGLLGMYQLMLDQGITAQTAALGVIALALLFIYAGFRLVDNTISHWSRRRSFLHREADPFNQTKDILMTLASDFIDGLRSEPPPPQRRKSLAPGDVGDVSDATPVIPLRRRQ